MAGQISVWVRLLGAFLLSALASLAMAIEVNTATAAELDSIRGIGPGISEKILVERKKGAFTSWQNMVDRVRGVGENNARNFAAGGLTVNGEGFKGVTIAPRKTAEEKDAAKAARAEEKAKMKAEKEAAKDAAKTAKAEEKAKMQAEKEAAKPAKQEANKASKAGKTDVELAQMKAEKDAAKAAKVEEKAKMKAEKDAAKAAKKEAKEKAKAEKAAAKAAAAKK